MSQMSDYLETPPDPYSARHTGTGQETETLRGTLPVDEIPAVPRIPIPRADEGYYHETPSPTKE